MSPFRLAFSHRFLSILAPVSALVLAWLGLLGLVPAALAENGQQQAACSGYSYVVRPDDSWSSLAARTGLSIGALQAANPQAVRANRWLFAGESLCVPSRVQPSLTRPSSGFWYLVQPGDTWSGLAKRTGLSMAALQQANPQALRPRQWLLAGERIWIPGAGARQTAAGAATLTPPPAASPSPASPTPSPEDLPSLCPDSLEAYGPASADLLTAHRGERSVLESFLRGCSVLREERGQVTTLALDDGDRAAFLIVAVDPAAHDQQIEGILSILTEGEGGWQVAYQSGLAADVSFLKANDINDDGNPEIVWSDTTCGAHSCFTTIHILSYVDGQFSHWIEGDTTMAGAEIAFRDVTPEGSGLELVMTGGVIASVGAGPQRAFTATWASLAGEPYTLFSRENAPSNCLYHQVLDANAALLAGQADNFSAAIAAYRRAIDHPALVACWIRPGEAAELRAFALYRLAVAQAYAGDLDAAAGTISELAATYPADSYAQVAEVWWAAYEPTQDARAACAAVAVFAEKNPDTWERLADYGYANPSFAVEDVCPIAR